MARAPTIRSLIITASLGILMVSSGCSDPRFKQQQEIRDARMKRHLDDYAAHEAAGIDRIRQTFDLANRIEEWHAENLNGTCRLVRSIHEQDVRRWKDEDSTRKNRLEALLRGNPDQIGDTYARMAY